MDPGGFLTHLLGRLRLSALAPSLAMGVEATARLCTSGHVPIHVLGMPPPEAPVHVDVDGHLWNKGGVPTFTVFDVRDAEARGQTLRTGEERYIGSFQEVTLEATGKREDVSFRLSPPEGETLVAIAGDVAAFKLRTSRPGRWRRVELVIEDRRR
jgi:hypothetical protein